MFHSWLVFRRRVISPGCISFVTVHTKAACSPVVRLLERVLSTNPIIVFMKCRAVRKAKGTCVPFSLNHMNILVGLFGFSIRRLILNASRFQKTNKLGNNTQKHSDTFRNGFLNILSGICSYHPSNCGRFFFLLSNASTFNLLHRFVPFLFPPSHPSCIFAHLLLLLFLLPADLVVVVQ